MAHIYCLFKEICIMIKEKLYCAKVMCRTENILTAERRYSLCIIHSLKLLSMLMLMKRNWSHYVDMLRDEIWQNHPQIQIVDFDFYSVEVFNRCENSNDVLMAVRTWDNVHPLLKVIPVEWNYAIPYGLLHSHTPSETVKQFLSAIQTVLQQ